MNRVVILITSKTLRYPQIVWLLSIEHNPRLASFGVQNLIIWWLERTAGMPPPRQRIQREVGNSVNSAALRGI